MSSIHLAVCPYAFHLILRWCMQNRPPLAWWISSQARQRETEASLTFLAPGTLCLPGRPLCRAQAFKHTQGCLA